MIEANQESDKKSPEIILARLMLVYMPYIQKRATSVTISGLEDDDLIQEGLVALFRAVESFDDQNGASFTTYAITCINNGISSAIKQACRKKHSPLKAYVSLSNESDDLLASNCTPEDITIASEQYNDVIKRINNNLSKMERDVLKLYLSGYDYLAVAKRLDTTPKSVDNALQRARKKLKSKQ